MLLEIFKNNNVIFFLFAACREQLVSEKLTFPELASKFSDCLSAKSGGKFGPFKRGDMQKPFERAAFALNVGELSEAI